MENTRFDEYNVNNERKSYHIVFAFNLHIFFMTPKKNLDKYISVLLKYLKNSITFKGLHRIE